MSFRLVNQLCTIYITFRLTRLVRDSARKRNERYLYRLCPTLQVRAVYTLWKGTGLPLLPFMRCWIYCWSANLKLEKSRLLSQDCTSSETQGLLVGTMRYFQASDIFDAKVYFKGWRAPGHFFLPNEFQKCRNPSRWLARKIFFLANQRGDLAG